MTSRERVVATIRGEPVDRVPVMYWLNPHMTCRMISEYRPSVSPGVNLAARLIWRNFEGKGEVEGGELARALPLLLDQFGNQEYVLGLGSDIAVISPEIASTSGALSSIRRVDGRLQFQGPLGNPMSIVAVYAEIMGPAVQTVDDLETYELPPVKSAHFDIVRKVRKRYPEACLLTEVMSFQQALSDFIMGTEAFMIALIERPEAISRMLDRMSDWIVEIIDESLKAGTDVIFLQDDYGMNERPLISPKLWAEMTLPHLARFVEASHAGELPFMLHSCGYQERFLPYYVEAGVDCLQSFQPGAGNDFRSAYEAYGDRLAFATGIDIQSAGALSPRELRDSIIEAYRIGRKHGRHVLGMTHMLQYNIPEDNLNVIFDTVNEIQSGLHD